jgi:hypothetical protein
MASTRRQAVGEYLKDLSVQRRIMRHAPTGGAA